MSVRPGDEFAHLFDTFTAAEFTPMKTVTYPSENLGFAEFVAFRVETARLGFVFEQIMLHVALSNGSEVRQLTLEAGEGVPEFIERVTANARDMMAHSMFYLNLGPRSEVLGNQCAWWIAAHLENGEQVIRVGMIAIERDHLGECAEITNQKLIAAASDPLRNVLMP